MSKASQDRRNGLILAFAFIAGEAHAGTYTPSYEQLTKNRHILVSQAGVKIIVPDDRYTQKVDGSEAIINRRNFYFLDRKGSYPNTDLVEIDQRSSSSYFHAYLTKIENNSISSATNCFGYRDEGNARRIVGGSSIKGFCVTVTPKICETAQSVLGSSMMNALQERLKTCEEIENLSRRIQNLMTAADYQKVSQANQKEVEDTYWKFRRPENEGKAGRFDTSSFVDHSRPPLKENWELSQKTDFEKIVSACEELRQKTEPEPPSAPSGAAAAGNGTEKRPVR
jgi:hypothetical protein